MNKFQEIVITFTRQRWSNTPPSVIN